MRGIDSLVEGRIGGIWEETGEPRGPEVPWWIKEDEFGIFRGA